MKIAISNIAWEHQEDEQIANLLKKENISGIEVAPTKIWPNPIKASKKTIIDYKNYWLKKGVKIVAIQSVLFGHPELTIFKDQETRNKTISYLSKMMTIASLLGAGIIVFGSPKNRRIGNLDYAKAMEIACDFFYQLAEISKKYNIFFCLEPNPPQYGADFILNADQAIDLIKKVNHSHFRLHLDSGTMILNKENYQETIKKGYQYLRHLHISEANLRSVPQNNDDHRIMAKTLKKLNYRHWVSIEMLGNPKTSNFNLVKKALEFVKSFYQ